MQSLTPMFDLIDTTTETTPCNRHDVEREFKLSAKTSIYRSKPSAPLQFLLSRRLIEGSTLNFGKGRYDLDSRTIREVTNSCTDYDFTYAYYPEVLGSHFQTVFCAYVINVLPPKAREVVFQQIADATDREKGKAFIAVRSDKDKNIRGVPEQDGVRTSINTYQIGFSEAKFLENIKPYFLHVEQIKSTSGYRLFSCSH